MDSGYWGVCPKWWNCNHWWDSIAWQECGGVDLQGGIPFPLGLTLALEFRRPGVDLLLWDGPLLRWAFLLPHVWTSRLDLSSGDRDDLLQPKRWNYRCGRDELTPRFTFIPPPPALGCEVWGAKMGKGKIQHRVQHSYPRPAALDHKNEDADAGKLFQQINQHLNSFNIELLINLTNSAHLLNSFSPELIKIIANYLSLSLSHRSRVEAVAGGWGWRRCWWCWW